MSGQRPAETQRTRSSETRTGPGLIQDWGRTGLGLRTHPDSSGPKRLRSQTKAVRLSWCVTSGCCAATPQASCDDVTGSADLNGGMNGPRAVCASPHAAELRASSPGQKKKKVPPVRPPESQARCGQSCARDKRPILGCKKESVRSHCSVHPESERKTRGEREERGREGEKEERGREPIC